MYPRFTVAVALLATPVSSAAQTSPITATSADGGTVVTDLGYNVKVNKNSTLRRTWITLNDKGAPVQLLTAGLNTEYAGREYHFESVGSAQATASVTAFEIRYLLYDIFGDHLKTLSNIEVGDLAQGASMDLKAAGSWQAWENEVSALLTIVAFVAHVRAGDGTIWRYNEKAVGDELLRIRLKAVKGVLDPTKQP